MNTIIYDIAVYLVTKLNEIITRLNNTYTKTQVNNVRDNLVSQISSVASNLANNYYMKSEIDANHYTKTEIDSMLGDYLKLNSATSQTVTGDVVFDGNVSMSRDLDMGGNDLRNAERVYVNDLYAYNDPNGVQVKSTQFTVYDIDIVGHAVINPSGISNQGSLTLKGDFDHSVGSFNSDATITTTGNVDCNFVLSTAVRTGEIQMGSGVGPRIIYGSGSPTLDDPEAPRGSLYLNSSSTNGNDAAYVSTQTGEDTVWHNLD
jgi:formylmethanofuran dehydrogenase subunit C